MWPTMPHDAVPPHRGGNETLNTRHGTSSHVQFPVAIEEGDDGFLIAEVIGLPGCRTQARSHDELLARVKEAISLYVEVKGRPDVHRFVALQQVDVEV